MILIAIILILAAMLLVWWLVIWLCGKIGQESFGEKGQKIGRGIPFWLGIAVIAYSVGFNIAAYGTYRYLCKHKAGTTIYKTVDQWKAENPGVWETLKKVSWKNVPYQDLPEEYKNNPKIKKEMIIDGKKYEMRSGGNQRILEYSVSTSYFRGKLDDWVTITYDFHKNEILSDTHIYI